MHRRVSDVGIFQIVRDQSWRDGRTSEPFLVICPYEGVFAGSRTRQAGIKLLFWGPVDHCQLLNEFAISSV